MVRPDTRSVAMSEIISKGEFAALLGVTPGRVSQYIAARKIDGDALVGEGRGARIRVAVACAQLRRRLDPSQRLGNGLGTRLDPIERRADSVDAGADQWPSSAGVTDDRAVGSGSSQQATAASGSASSPSPATVSAALPASVSSPSDALDDRIRRARLEGIERDNRRKAEEEAARAGRYVLAADTRAEMTRLAREMLTVFDGAIADLAAAVAAKFGLQQRDVVHLMRLEARGIRARAAQAAAARVNDLPAMVEDEIDTGGAAEVGVTTVSV